ncbi:MAG: sulfurtransferase TusA family protein [Actinomycetota bacterium]|nr:sulfurtransferase TusA family protein [Actinomycetota bacterium]
MNVDLWIDERGRRCPIPVISLARAQTTWFRDDIGVDEVVGMLADDPAAEYDIPAWCRLKGAEFLGSVNPPDGGSGMGYVVRFSASKHAA